MVENWIEQLSEKSGRFVSWFNVILVLVICIDVIMRYFFNASQAWITEFEWHLFAMIFLVGAAYTLKHDDHVRVDLFYARLPERSKAWINIVGIVVFLIPWCLVVLRASWKYAHNSFKINEGSPDPGGLPYRWFIKYMIVLGFIILLLQAIGLLLRCINVLRGKQKTIFPKIADS